MRDADAVDREARRLLAVYRRTGDRRYRDRLMRQYRDLVYHMAHKHFRLYKTLLFEDAITEAFLGLLSAIEKFDLKQSVKFITYATVHIRFALQNVFWPSESRYLKPDPPTVPLYVPCVGYSYYTLENPLVEMKAMVVFEESGFERRVEDRLILTDAISTLDEQRQLIVYLYGIDGLTDLEIGHTMNKTRARIQQIRKESLTRLRDQLEPIYAYQ